MKSIDSVDGEGHLHRANNYSRTVASELISCFFYITEPFYYNVPASMFTIFDQIGERGKYDDHVPRRAGPRERERESYHITHTFLSVPV